MSFFEFPHTRTYDADLGWLIKKVSSYNEVIEALDAWIEEYQPKIEDFENLYNMMMAGNLPEGVQRGIEDWLSRNAIDLIGKLVKMVIFNITDDGYFVAYIPESWDEIIFNTTGLDISLALQPEYGHLVLSYAGNTRAY